MFEINGHRLHGWHDGKDPFQKKYDELSAHCDDSFNDSCLFFQFEDLYYDYVGVLDEAHENDIFYSLRMSGLNGNEALELIRKDGLMELPPADLEAYLRRTRGMMNFMKAPEGYDWAKDLEAEERAFEEVVENDLPEGDQS